MPDSGVKLRSATTSSISVSSPSPSALLATVALRFDPSPSIRVLMEKYVENRRGSCNATSTTFSTVFPNPSNASPKRSRI